MESKRMVRNLIDQLCSISFCRTKKKKQRSFDIFNKMLIYAMFEFVGNRIVRPY